MTTEPIGTCGNCGATCESNECSACGATLKSASLLDPQDIECLFGVFESVRIKWIMMRPDPSTAPQTLAALLVALEASLILTRHNLISCLKIRDDEDAVDRLDNFCTEAALTCAEQCVPVTASELELLTRGNNPQA